MHSYYKVRLNLLFSRNSKKKKKRQHLDTLFLAEGQKSTVKFTYVNSPKEGQTLETPQKTTSITETNIVQTFL